MSIKIFIDTEFTDFIEPQLISVGLVSEAGDEFYAEVPFDRKACSDFVLQTVVPMLGYVSDAYSEKSFLSEKLIGWLLEVRHSVDSVVICCDSQIDWDLFLELLRGEIPPWCQKRLIADCLDENLRLSYYEESRRPEHHALNDAHANRRAFREQDVAN